MIERQLEVGQMPSDVDYVVTSGGRKLAYEVSGHPDGVPVFLLHGTPGSRVGIKPRSFQMALRKILLISYDRPGYGWSDRRQGRKVADAAEDVAVISDHLGYERFGVVGRSGGGPHALACAAMLGERVIRTVGMCGLAPPEYVTGKMASSNASVFGNTDDSQVIRDITARAQEARVDPESILKNLYPEMHHSDRRVLSEVAIRQLVVNSFEEALKNGPGGWIDDALAFRGDWGFRLKDIQGPVTLWAARDDPFVPIESIQAYADRIPGAKLEVHDGSHFNAIDAMASALTCAATDL